MFPIYKDIDYMLPFQERWMGKLKENTGAN